MRFLENLRESALFMLGGVKKEDVRKRMIRFESSEKACATILLSLQEKLRDLEKRENENHQIINNYNIAISQAEISGAFMINNSLFTRDMSYEGNKKAMIN